MKFNFRKLLITKTLAITLRSTDSFGQLHVSAKAFRSTFVTRSRTCVWL